MKKKTITLSLLAALAMVIVALAALVIYKSWSQRRFRQDYKWIAYAQEAGFLIAPDVTVRSYVKANEILQQNGIDLELLEKSVPTSSLTSALAQEQYIELVLDGAKAKGLGIKTKTPEPFVTEMYTSDGRRLELKDFKVLAKATAYFANLELYRQNIDRAILLCKANMALGTQFSACYDIDFMHMFGIVCKDLGLKTLKECAVAKGDKELNKLVLELREVLNEEFEAVKKMPVRQPSSAVSKKLV